MEQVNDYSWCGESSLTLSAWDQKVKNFSDYSIPLFLSEYGCNAVPERPFTEVEALYGEEMTPVFSGGLVYEYSNEANKYGLVQIGSKDVTTLGDFDRLKTAFEKTPIPDDDGGYKSDGQASECPPKTDEWEASDDIPPMPDSASQYLEIGAGPPRGTDGTSNQYNPKDQEAPSDTGTAGPPPTSIYSGKRIKFLSPTNSSFCGTPTAAGTDSIPTTQIQARPLKLKKLPPQVGVMRPLEPLVRGGWLW